MVSVLIRGTSYTIPIFLVGALDTLPLRLGFKIPSSPAGRNGDARNFFTRNLCERIKVAERFQFVAEKFQPRGPWTGQRPDIQNAAAQGDFALLRDLRFGFVALFLEPFDQIQRIDFVTALQRARALLNFTGWKSFLEQGGDAGNNQVEG